MYRARTRLVTALAAGALAVTAGVAALAATHTGPFGPASADEAPGAHGVDLHALLQPASGAAPATAAVAPQPPAPAPVNQQPPAPVIAATLPPQHPPVAENTQPPASEPASPPSTEMPEPSAPPTAAPPGDDSGPSPSASEPPDGGGDR